MDDAFVPRLAKKARLRFDRHEKQHMIVYPERGLLLNETAAAIAGKCDGSRSIGAIVETLCAEHPGSSPDEVRHDVIAFVTSLRDKGLLEP